MKDIIFFAIFIAAALYFAISVTILLSTPREEYPKMWITNRYILPFLGFFGFMVLIGSFILYMELQTRIRNEKNPPVYEQVTEPVYRLKTP
jgi:ABC-type multidrug transport system permease subunit